jgi:hypothetical protein
VGGAIRSVNTTRRLEDMPKRGKKYIEAVKKIEVWKSFTNLREALEILCATLLREV